MFFNLHNYSQIENVQTYISNIPGMFKHMLNSPENIFYTTSSWTGAIHIISIIIITTLILILGLSLPTDAKFIKFLNFVGGIFLLLNLYISSWDIITHFTYIIKSSTIQNSSNDLFWYVQSHNMFVNLFKLLASLLVAFFLLGGVFNKYYSTESSKLEFPLLIFFTHLSALFIITSGDFISLIISLECLAFCSYILVGFERRNKFSSSSGIKYLILGSVPGGFFILGASILYKNYGSLYFSDVYNLITHDFIETTTSKGPIILPKPENVDPCLHLQKTEVIRSKELLENFINKNNIVKKDDAFPLPGVELINGQYVISDIDEYHAFQDSIIAPALELHKNLADYNLNLNELHKEVIYDQPSISIYVALILILSNLLFKLTAAPFHAWAPSVYGGSPLPTVAFLSIFSKLTILWLLTQLVLGIFYPFHNFIQPILMFCGVLSIICGIIGAFTEKLIKRFFVYSSMGHVGFMLLGISTFSINGATASINYLFVYILSSLILWFILMILTKKTTHLTNLKGLGHNHPTLAFILSITMFSLSGIPPLAGFFVKFEIFRSIIMEGQYYLAFLLFLLTVISFFYYLRIIKIIYFENTSKFYKSKDLNESKLRIVSILFHIIVAYVLFIQEPLLNIIEIILTKTFVKI